MENIETTTYDYSPLVIGNAQYESASVVVGGDTTLVAGTVLVRSESNFVAATSDNLTTGVGAGVLVEEFTNSTGSNKTVNTRVLIAGDVVIDKLVVGETAITAAQADILRANSIVCTKRTEMARE